MAKRPSSARRAARAATISIVLSALAIGALAFVPTASQAQSPTPIDLLLTPNASTVNASWGVSSTTGLTGFRVHWRRQGGGGGGGRVELDRSARSYSISGLRSGTYLVRVRAQRRGRLGRAAESLVTVSSGAEEPPAEEEPAEEEPAEEEEPPAEEEPAEEEAPAEGGGAGEPVWYADPIRPVLSDWANIAAEPGRVTTKPLAAMPYGFAYVDEIRDGDNPGGYGERSEFAEGNPTRAGLEDRLFRQNEERWIAFPFELGADYPIGTRSWSVIMQIKQLGALGTPILSMGSTGTGAIGLFNSNSNGNTSGNYTRWSGPVKVGQVTEILLHVKFSPDANVGFVELFGDLNGQGIEPLMGKTFMSTMKQSGGIAVDDQARLGQYRDAAPKSGTSHVYYGRYVVAQSRSVAEAYAFE
jgi:hypothetical protein